jgi:hypothetical protein
VSAARELLAQRFEFSTAHLAAVLSACVFAPSLLTFWFVSGVIDLSTAFVLGSLAGPGGLTVRLVADLLLVPTYLLVRATHYLAHPVHRAAVLSGTCPRRDPARTVAVSAALGAPFYLLVVAAASGRVSLFPG